MEQHHTLHIIALSHQVRAAVARTGYALGHHCEVYADAAELAEREPQHGIVLCAETPDPDGGGGAGLAAAAVAALTRAGCWLPVIALDADPQTNRVVAAVKKGVLDYLPLPLDAARLSDSLARISADVAAHGEAQRQAVAAARRMADLSRREREVLDWLTRGCSNKAIARQLTISPRTVEIHRAKMMTKLGARHAAEAIRLRLEAGACGLVMGVG
ncbi:helix-turn-helix transcriptional regulator [Erythrobacteraceae bacterium CFH 75059]|nr:helix-turn-helix transcriptional regulator [Erythrobacteraceae bacterium CFH 75059]